MIHKSASEQEQENMHNYDMWVDIILNDPDAWDIGMMRVREGMLLLRQGHAGAQSGLGLMYCNGYA